MDRARIRQLALKQAEQAIRLASMEDRLWDVPDDLKQEVRFEMARVAEEVAQLPTA